MIIQKELRILKISKKRFLLRLIKLFNIVLLTIPFVVCWFGYYEKKIYSHFDHYGNWSVVILFIIFYVIFARIYDAFLVSLYRISEMIYSQILAVAISDGFMYLIIWLLMEHLPNIVPGIIALAIQCFLTIIWSVFSHKWYFSAFAPKCSAIIHGDTCDIESLICEYKMDKKFNVARIIPVNECVHDLRILDSFETVFLNDVHSHERNCILKYCIEHSICVYVIPRVGDVILSGATRMHMFHLPILRVGRYSPNPEYIILKRLLDLIIAGSAAIILSPVMLITGIAIKMYDHGPVFYKQVRLTKDGEEFNVIKFRSMRVNAESNGVARLSSGENDPRITPVGRIIRKLRVDELPQLFNILEGSMSIVGPRPERPEIAAQYEKILPEFRLRLQAKAGLTGYAQVYGKYNTTPYDKLKMDLMYIAHPSIWEDLMICFATVKILFMPVSTEGIEENQTTAMDRYCVIDDVVSEIAVTDLADENVEKIEC